MKLHKKVLLVWYLRTFALAVLLFPVIDIVRKRLGISLLWTFAVTGIVITSAFLLLYIKFKSCRLSIEQDRIQLQSGILLFRTLIIKHRDICAVRLIRTPLLKAFGLCGTVLYCEGATFLLPPVEEAAAKTIRELAHPEDIRQ